MNIEVSTVDGFQGREKEVIVLSLVRSNQDKELGFVTDFRRLNVAVTRARRSLIIIADSETMEKDELIVSLLKHIEDHGLLQSAEEYLSQNIDKEIEEIEKTSQNNIVNTKSKSKTKSSKRDKDKEKPNNTEFSALKDKPKPNEQTQKTSTGKVRKPRGTDINSTINRKKYNVYEAIASKDLGEEGKK